MSDYEFLKPIGTGSTSIVYKSVDKLTSKPVAVKRTKVINSSKNQLEKEFLILINAVCPNIIHAYDYIKNDLFEFLILEYAEEGDLLTYANSHNFIPEETIKTIFRQMCIGIKYLHDKNIVHSDIKLENVFIFNKDLLVKIADLGLSVTFDPNKKVVYNSGSPLYIAPEIILQVPVIGPEVDIWSLGIVLYALLYKKMPLKKKNKDEIPSKEYLKFAVAGPKFKITNLEESNYPVIQRSIEVEKLVLSMLNVSVKSRLTINEILKSHWLQPPIKLDLSGIINGIPRIKSGSKSLSDGPYSRGLSNTNISRGSTPTTPINNSSPMDSPVNIIQDI